MVVANPREVPEYELNPLELQVRKIDGITKVCSLSCSFYMARYYFETHFHGYEISTSFPGSSVFVEKKCAQALSCRTFSFFQDALFPGSMLLNLGYY